MAVSGHSGAKMKDYLKLYLNSIDRGKEVGSFETGHQPQAQWACLKGGYDAFGRKSDQTAQAR
jgi:hypothetical protein